jgi:hypothetical protein
LIAFDFLFNGLVFFKLKSFFFAFTGVGGLLFLLAVVVEAEAGGDLKLFSFVPPADFFGVLAFEGNLVVVGDPFFSVAGFRFFGVFMFVEAAFLLVLDTVVDVPILPFLPAVPVVLDVFFFGGSSFACSYRKSTGKLSYGILMMETDL